MRRARSVLVRGTIRGALDDRSARAGTSVSTSVAKLVQFVSSPTYCVL